MKPTTIKELNEIVKTIKVPEFKGPYKYTHTVTPELQAAIADMPAFEKYLDENFPKKIKKK